MQTQKQLTQQSRRWWAAAQSGWWCPQTSSSPPPTWWSRTWRSQWGSPRGKSPWLPVSVRAKDDECERKVQLRFSLQGWPWKVHFHSSLWPLLISLIKYLMLCSNLAPLPPCPSSLAEIHQTHLPLFTWKMSLPVFFVDVLNSKKIKNKGQLNYISVIGEHLYIPSVLPTVVYLV